MRPFTLTIIFLFCLGFSSYAQVDQATFTLHDGQLDQGSVMIRRDILFDLEKATMRPEDSIPLDSMANWMKLHPEFMIEVGNHTDYVNPKSSMRLTQARANAIREYLVARGVQATKITAVGYGDSRNIIPMAEILKIESKQLQQEKRAVNRRTEFKIIAVYASLIHPFHFTDSLFWPGEVLQPTCAIIYDMNHFNLRPESFPCIDTIIDFLKAHPQMKMEVGSHTDSRGSDAFNLKLSQNRAESVVQYMVSKGIDPSRLQAKGYGETQPIWIDIELHFKTPEEKEAKYQVNRRTEFKIIS